MSGLQTSAKDLVASEGEPIAPPQIQATYALLLFDRETGALQMGSDNLEPVFGAPLSELLGAKPSAFFEGKDAAFLNDMLLGADRPASQYVRLHGRQEHFARVFETDGLLGVELSIGEHAQSHPAQLGLDVANALQSIEDRASDLTCETEEQVRDFAQFIARAFRAFSGFDRSMVCRFDAAGNGEVIAECRTDAVRRSCLGLRIPASEFPARARDYFLRNRICSVVDVTQGSVPILPVSDPRTGEPVDLSDCAICSPNHAGYLRDHGMRATLDIALMANGKLWGLLSGHKVSAPYRLSPARAATCRLLADRVSTELTRIQERVEAAAAKRIKDCLRSLQKTLLEGEPGQSLEDLLSQEETALLSALGCDGAALVVHEAVYPFGQTPPPPVIDEVDARARTVMDDQNRDTFSTHAAVGLWPDLAADIATMAAGVFSSRLPDENCRLLMFRGPAAAIGANEDPSGSLGAPSEVAKACSLPWATESSTKARAYLNGLSELDWLLGWRKAEFELAGSRAEVAHATLHDAMTGLPNRRHLMEMLEESDEASPKWSAVLHIDLDGFKLINDRLGHAAGDAVLVEVASRLSNQTRKSDFCARIGGDEFSVLCANDLVEKEVIALGTRLVAVISQPVSVGEEVCDFGVSVGIAFTYDEPTSGETLLHRADLALDESKRNGQGRVTVFSEDLEDRLRRTQKLGEEILTALRGGQFEPWYQPQVDAHTLEVCGVEALMRWNHPTLGVLTPEKFLEIAENTGHIGTLDAIAMERALADHRLWRLEGFDIPKVSLNMSYDRLADAELIQSIKSVGLPPDVFCFELLETIYLDETPRAVQWNLDLLRERGIRVEIDDFGTGKTSIVSLVHIRPHRLKIDRQLVQPIVQSPQSRRLISSIVEIGASLGIGITAEGVESMEHANVLRDLGVTVLQGYAFGKPMPSRELIRFMQERARRVAT